MTNDEYKSLSRLVNLANKRLERLERFSGKDVSWAGKRLQSKIDNGKLEGWTNGRINIRADMNEQQLRRIENATKDFMNSSASTVTGVRKIMQHTIRSLGANLSISKDQAESLYQMLSDDSFMYIKEYSVSKPSEIWVVIQEAKEKRYNFKTFQKRILEVAQVIPDEEMKANIQNLFISEVLGVK